MRELLGELFDMLLFLGVTMGLLMFSILYWKEAYCVRYAETVMEEFLEDAASDGGFSKAEYDALLERIWRINPDYSLRLECERTEKIPCYAKIPKEQLDEYYMGRNVRREISLQEDTVPEEIISMDARLQKETNASLLAAGEESFLKLPEEGKIFSIRAVRPSQGVYVGEELITLCLVVSEAGNYYIEADRLCAEASGTTELSVSIDGECYYAEVEVVCYPRTLVCDYGHLYENTWERIEVLEKTGKLPECPVCVKTPAGIQCSQKVCVLRVGEELKDKGLYITVAYMDGHCGTVYPGEDNWQDNYDSNYCGMQQVMVRYGTCEDIITVVTEGGYCRQCFKACSGRNYEDYKGFPYCTECMSEQLLFTGEFYEDIEKIRMQELTAVVDEKNFFSLEEADRLAIGLYQEDRLLSLLQKIIKRGK